MRLWKQISLVLMFGCVALAGAQQTIIDPNTGITTGRLGVNGGTTYQLVPGSGYRVNFPTQNANLVMVLPANTSWSGLSHLDISLVNNGSSPAELTFAVSSANNGWLYSQAVVFGGNQIDVSVPLQAPLLGLRCLPSSSSTRVQTNPLGSVTMNSIGNVFIYSGTPSANISLLSVATASRSIPTTQIVDQYGQQQYIDWVGKITNDTQLQQGSSESLGLPYTADDFGGAIGGTNYGASTRFRVRNDGGHWYLVTPEGNRFFSLGVNEVGAVAWSPIQGRENLYTGIGQLQQLYPDGFSNRNGLLGYVPYAVNLERKFGANWRSSMDQTFMDRLQDWGFNTVGANSWDSLLSQQRMPSTTIVSILGNHRMLNVYDGKQMPDVFDPGFRPDVVSSLTNRIGPGWFTNHPYNVGMFVDNEMPWGMGRSSDPNYRYGIAMAALRTPSCFAHKALVRQLISSYRSPSRLNRAWGTSYRSWSELLSSRYVPPTDVPEGMQQDLGRFNRTFADKYFNTIKSTLQMLNYRGLYLGCRFTFQDYTPEALASAQNYCDVLSFNIYCATLDACNPDLRSLNFPIMISEMCFGANDKGRVGMPLYPTLTDSDRVAAYRRYMDNVKTWPNVVGVHWYRWEDFPVTAKSDGDNMAMGLQSIADQPYANLVTATRTKSQEIMAQVASGF